MKSKLNFFYVNILCAARLGVIENLSVVSHSQVLHKTRFWKFIPERRHCQCGKEGIFLHVIISMMWSPYHVIVSVIIKSLSLRLRVTFFPPIPHRSGAMNSNLWNLKFCQVQSFVKAQNSKLSYVLPVDGRGDLAIEDLSFLFLSRSCRLVFQYVWVIGTALTNSHFISNGLALP